MAGRGPAPKENAVRRNAVDLSHLEGDPDVPDRMRKVFKRDGYSVATQRWWDTWAESDQAESFKATDWQRLQMLAPLVEAYFRRPGHNALAEIRQNESLLGATVTDRMRLRMNKAEPKKGDEVPDTLPENVKDLELYRSLSGT
ncbi:phage terminase small subunit [Herbidospora sp. RD11066]